MDIQIITREDLETFRLKLLDDIREIILKHPPVMNIKPEGYKTSDVRKILGCSVNKLVALRISGFIRTKKIGGTIYYSTEDVKSLLEKGY